ncbi:MAG TPA: zinc ribbon domain-containing protein [Syntrophomonas sp.]|nr:zinc ribbon domain-containing protein [Syntrophomonas sp.]
MCFRPPEINKLMQKCPACGTLNKRDKSVTVCKKCGAELVEETIPCPECGVPQPVSNKVCGNCGFNGKPGSGDPAKRKPI